MRISILIFIFLFSFLLTAQQKRPTFDGEVSPQEWGNAESFDINYEVNPGNNIPSTHLTKVFITYSKTDLYVGFIAYADMNNLRSSVRNRDEGYQDDNVMVGIDTYRDSRYMISLRANAEGNQLDAKFLPSGDDYVSYYVSFESKSSKHEDSYHV
jgi:hypothetical protein